MLDDLKQLLHFIVYIKIYIELSSNINILLEFLNIKEILFFKSM